VKDKSTESELNSHPYAISRNELGRKLERARAHLLELRKNHRSHAKGNQKEKPPTTDQDLQIIQEEIMWLEMQLQAIDGGLALFRVEQHEGENKLKRLGIAIQREGEQRMSQFGNELKRLEGEIRRVRKLYLELIAKLGELLREAHKTEAVIERARKHIPQDQRVKGTVLRSPTLSEFAIDSKDVQTAYGKPAGGNATWE
jgi:hypothetical protein